MRRLVVAVMLSGCGGGFECTEDIRGTYRISWEEEPGGTCGPLADQVVFISGEIPAECEVFADDRDMVACTYESDVECADAGNDLVTRQAGTVTQTEADGAAYEGTVTSSVRRLSTGETVCVSTYAVVYAKE